MSPRPAKRDDTRTSVVHSTQCLYNLSMPTLFSHHHFFFWRIQLCPGLFVLVKPTNVQTIQDVLPFFWLAAVLTFNSCNHVVFSRYRMPTQFQEYARGDAGGWTLQWRSHAVHQRAGAAERGKQACGIFWPLFHHFLVVWNAHSHVANTWRFAILATHIAAFYFHSRSPSLVCFEPFGLEMWEEYRLLYFSITVAQ